MGGGVGGSHGILPVRWRLLWFVHPPHCSRHIACPRGWPADSSTDRCQTPAAASPLAGIASSSCLGLRWPSAWALPSPYATSPSRSGDGAASGKSRLVQEAGWGEPPPALAADIGSSSNGSRPACAGAGAPPPVCQPLVAPGETLPHATSCTLRTERRALTTACTCHLLVCAPFYTKDSLVRHTHLSTTPPP